MRAYDWLVFHIDFGHAIVGKDHIAHDARVLVIFDRADASDFASPQDIGRRQVSAP